ncbi:MAG: hypothetical protein PUD47_06895 [Bacteroidales bacterium]|nr:hypothetical protein [Bacteroidales bacterium]
MISGNINKFSYRLGTVDHQYIAFGSTISQMDMQERSLTSASATLRSALLGRKT